MTGQNLGVPCRQTVDRRHDILDSNARLISGRAWQYLIHQYPFLAAYRIRYRCRLSKVLYHYAEPTMPRSWSCRFFVIIWLVARYLARSLFGRERSGRPDPPESDLHA